MSDPNHAVLFALVARRVRQLQRNIKALSDKEQVRDAQAMRDAQAIRDAARGDDLKFELQGLKKIRFEADGAWGPWLDFDDEAHADSISAQLLAAVEVAWADPVLP